MKISAIITGATGMVGEGVLQEALQHPDIEKVLVINRRPCGVAHPKLAEILHTNFLDLSPIAEQLKGFNACFFCLGVSSVGMKEDVYYSMTYTLTIHFAETLLKQSPEITFCYISGAGTDSSEKGKINWARVKGKTENDLMRMPFRKVYAFRPAFMLPAKGAKNAPQIYILFRILYPVLRAIFPKFVTTLKEVATCMINTVIKGYVKPILEVPDILKLANN